MQSHCTTIHCLSKRPSIDGYGTPEVHGLKGQFESEASRIIALQRGRPRRLLAIRRRVGVEPRRYLLQDNESFDVAKRK